MSISIPARLLPQVNPFLLALLRPALPGAQVVSVMPPLEQRVYPLVLARRVPGSGAVHARFVDRATVQVDCFSPSRADADRVAELVRLALFSAWHQQVVATTGGHIGFFEEQSGPAELRNDEQPAELHRWTATYVLLIRP